MLAPMKVLILCDVLFPQTTGGAGRFARELASALERHGTEVHFLTRATVRAPEQQEKHATYYPPPGRKLPQHYRTTFRRLLEKFHADILHVHQPLPAFLCLPRVVSKPVVQTFHSSWSQELKVKWSPWPLLFRRAGSILFAAIERQALRRADIITVLSEYSRAEVERLYHLPATIIPGGAASGRFKPCLSPESDGVVRLITVRNLVPRMGLFELVEAMSLLPSNIRLDIGGDGPLRAALEERVQALGLRQRILLRGHIPDDELPGFYSAADWFVLPSVAQEGFGLVILESLSCGTPVLGTRIGAIPELLERFDPAWVIPEPNPRSIADTVLSALKRPVPDRNALHRRIANEFDWDRIAERYIRLFMSLVQHEEPDQ